MPDTLAFDPLSITIDELDELKTRGVSFADFAKLKDVGLGGLDPGVLRAIVYLANRRHDPAFTWEDTGRFSFADLVDMLEAGDDEDPTVPPVS